MVEGLACQCERVRSTGCPTLLEEEEEKKMEKEKVKENEDGTKETQLESPG